MRESIFSLVARPTTALRWLLIARVARPAAARRSLRIARVVGITASLLTAMPASALACPVCALVGTRNNTWAYQAMTAMLTLLPLAMVGATVWWLARLAAR